MGRTVIPRPCLIQAKLTNTEMAAFLEWQKDSLLTRSQLVGMTALAWKEGRLFILDRPTLDVLQGAAEDRIMRKVKRWALTTVLEELHRQGFNPTPYDK